LNDADSVLDIATGTGEPGLTIARQVPNGKVTGTDLAEDMLLIASGNAEAQGIKNYTTAIADVCELPFASETFDALSCRMGFMFFPNMQTAAQQMYRVLKPGGRAATSVWAAPNLNNWVTTTMSVIQKHVQLPPPVPGAPGMFRCSEPGLIAGLFANEGFKNITETTITGKVNYHSFNQYWEMMLDVGAPIVAALSTTDDATRETIKQEVATLFKTRNNAGEAMLDFAAIIVAGEK
jgi:SAM-dependent methyltransferase